MKKLICFAGIVFLQLTTWSVTGWSMDFVNMSNEELFELQGAIRNAPEADRKAYEAEWEKRVSGMTDEEKKVFVDADAEKQTDDGKLDEPRIPAGGYEKEGIQGQIIFGGFPDAGASGK